MTNFSDQERFQAIRTIIEKNPIVVFMKGTPDHPYCGFSGVVVRIFQHLNVSFYGIDILQDPVMREDLKLFSQWPTFPQIYMGGVFIGGCDILKNLYETQELHNMIKPYVSS